MTDILEILKSYWGYPSFRPLQENIIASVISGKDTLALLPTGGGKSLCFQVPALAQPGLCLVVSPLIALMKDQVENLRKKNITAFSIHSGMSRKEVKHTLELAGHSNCKFLYLSPERLETSLFKEYLPSLGVSLLAVDEAHCISQWGYDFRPSYLSIADLREELPGVPVLALTASATKEVQDDICARLHFKDPAIYRQSFERPNLSYSAFAVDSKINKILDVLNKVDGTSIVYCRSRKRTKEISDLLNMHGIAADYYHAGLAQELRNEKQELWLNNSVRCMVCTNAFGMGIDKPDVRTVLHADTTDCLENYYQEAGRAGRDGKKSYAVLLYNDAEIAALKKLPEIRFPPLSIIRSIYQALMNYLQIPSGAGQGNSFDIDLNSFILQFSLDTQHVLAVLKTLEQEEIVAFNEQVFSLSKLEFTVNKQLLYDFENEHPHLEPLIKTLLRTYEGIIDQPVAIHERTLAVALKETYELVKNKLVELHRYGIVQYYPQKDKPQLYLIRNLVKAADLHIDMDAYRKRKKKFEARIEELVEYTYSTDTCRSVRIGVYFGDNEMMPCGVCDNCLRLKKQPLDNEEFERIHQMIINALLPSGRLTNDLVEHLGGSTRDKTWQVIKFLQAEDKVIINEKGWMTAK